MSALSFSSHLHEPVAASDASLVESAKGGDHSAYVKLYELHRNSTVCMVQRITRNTHDTEDVIQDACMRGFIYIKTFDGRSAFSTWFGRIAINSALMLLRKKRRRVVTSLSSDDALNAPPPIDVVDASCGPEETLLFKEQRRLLEQAIATLPPVLREVTVLRQTTGASVKELSTLTGISVPAMKSRLARARAALREQLQQA